MSYLGIDIGTSSIKGLLINDAGRILDKIRVRNKLITNDIDRVEIDPFFVLDNLENIIKSLSWKNKKDPISSMAFSCLGTAMIPIDRKGNILYNGISALDKRSIGYLDWYIGQEISHDDIYRITGQPPDCISFLHNYLWLRENKKDILRRIYKFLSLNGLFIYKICGQTMVDFSMASRTMLMDMENNKWSANILDRIGFDLGKLPALKSPSTIIEIPRKQLLRLNLKSNTKLILGGLDACCGYAGTGNTSGVNLVNLVGTYEHLMSVTNRYKLEQRSFFTNNFYHNHILDGQYISYSRINTGYIIDCFMKSFLNNKSYDEMFLSIDDKPGSIYFFPFFNDSELAGNSNGIGSNTAGMSRKTNKEDLFKGILEGINFILKRFLNQYEDCRTEVENIYVTGGGSSSPNVLKLKANILNKRIIVLKEKDCSCLGALLLALKGSGKYNINGAMEILRNDTVAVVEPDPIESKAFASKYDAFWSIYDKNYKTQKFRKAGVF